MDRPLNVTLTDEQNAALLALADALGVTPELAAAKAIDAALKAKFAGPGPGAVRPIRPKPGPESWRRLIQTLPQGGPVGEPR